MYLYSKTVLKSELSFRERAVLREYLNNGYSQQTKKGICLDLGITNKNLNTLNCTLQKKGFLYPNPHNQRLKLVSKSLLQLRDCFTNETESKNCFIVNFVR